MDCELSVPLYFLFFKPKKVEWLGHKTLLLNLLCIKLEKRRCPDRILYMTFEMNV